MGVVLGLRDSKLFILYLTWVQLYSKPLSLSWLAQISNDTSSKKRVNPSLFLFVSWGILFYFLKILTFLSFIKASSKRDECCLFPSPLVMAAAYPKSLSGSFFETTHNIKQTVWSQTVHTIFFHKFCFTASVSMLFI